MPHTQRRARAPAVSRARIPRDGPRSRRAVGSSLAAEMLRRNDEGGGQLLPAETVAALTRIPQTDDAQLHSEYTVNYSGNDFVRAVVACIGALAPACVTRP